jgi:tetratricopeptide (TPR) repeat protein
MRRGHSHSRTSPDALNNPAALCQRQGRYAEAEPLFKLALREKSLPSGHPDVGQSLNNLATLYEKQDRHANSEPLVKRSLAIRENVLGRDHADVARSLNNLASLYQSRGPHDRRLAAGGKDDCERPRATARGATGAVVRATEATDAGPFALIGEGAAR